MSNSQSKSEKTQFSQALSALNRIGQTLVVIQDLPETLKQIAGSAREVLGADIVDLYEYVQVRNEFILPPILCGERRNPFIPKEKIYEDDVAVKIVKAGKPQYYPDARATSSLTEKFVVPRADAPEQRFVIREGVESSVSLPLMAGEETVGVMFVNYRTKQAFDDEQKTLIESFSHLAAIAICNARLYKSEHERRLLYETLQETAHVVNESLSTKEVSESALEQLGKVIEYSSASVQLFDGDHRDLLSVRTSRQIPDAPELHRDISDDPLVSQIVQNRQPRVLRNVEDEPLWERLPQTEHIKSWIGVPLIAKGQVIGLLTVDHGETGYYTPEMGEIVAAFASQLAVAMHNSIQAQALARLSQLSQRLVSLSEEHEDFRKLLEDVAKSAKEVLRADIIELYEYSQARKKYELPQITVGERRGPFVPKDEIFEDDVVMKLIHRAQFSYVKDAQRDALITGDYTIERKDKPAERFAVREEIQSTAAIPLKSGDEPVGLMFANYRTPQEFTNEQKELIELFANQAAIAIQNARLYKQLNRKIEDLNVLGEIGQQLTANMRLQEQEILELVHQQAGELMDADNMYIALYDVKKDMINFGLAFENGKPISVKPRKIDDARRGRTEEIVRTGQHIFIATKKESEEWYHQPGRAEFIGQYLASWIGVPMVVRQKVIGVIATYHPTKDNVYSKDDLDILQAMAAQAAIALDNSRTFQALVEFGQKVSAGIGLQENEILELIYEQASKLMDTDNMYIALYDDKPEDKIRFGLAFQNGKPIIVESRKIDDTRRGRTEEIIRTKQSIFIAKQKESEDWYRHKNRQSFVKPALPSWIGVPMMADDKVLGVVATYHPTREDVYSEGDVRILQSMANIAAVALENARRYGELEDANARIAQKEAILVRSMIASDFVHRLNNLAGTIPAWVDLVRESLEQNPPPMEDVLDYLDKIWRDANDLLRAAEQLKDMPREQQVDVVFVLQSMLRQIRIQYRKSITVSETIQPDLYKVCAVPFALTGALSSVVSNGVDAMMELGGGTLTVNAHNKLNQTGKQGIQIEIRDTGPGIPADFIDNLFVPFLSTKGKGRGYGLWRAKTVIEELGGSIQVESTLGNGATFTLWLPKSVQEELNVSE